MDTIHYLNEEHVLTFLVEILVLLVIAKVLGELCQQKGIPALAGEIFTGILLGPTILGRVWPSLEQRIFPIDSYQRQMLETVSWFGVLFLLLATGFEVKVSSVWKQGRVCLTIGFVAVIIPFAMGCGVFWWLPESYWGPSADRLTFTLFLATAAAISAIPVIAKVLYDLDILKSDFGLTTLSAFIVNDVLGWMIFTFVLGLAVPEHGNDVARTLFEIVLFVTVCLTVGSKLVGALTVRMYRSTLPQPGTTLTFICCLGLLCGAITQWMGVHAILGFFLAGVMAGNAPEIPQRTQTIISQMIYAVFVPIFFATIGIKVDFLRDFDVLLILLVTTVAVGGKFLGAWAGARVAGLPKGESFCTGIAHIPGGAMEIVVGMLALEMRLIPENVFVAVVFASLASSIAVGPLLAWAIRRLRSADLHGVVLRDAICLDLRCDSRWEAIKDLCSRVARSCPNLNAEDLFTAVREREELMGTGLERGVAVPHARVRGLDRSIIAFARLGRGIDWDSRDGEPSRFVFLILTPHDEEGLQVHILSSIATAMMQPAYRARLTEAMSEDDVYELLEESLGHGDSGHEPQPA